MADGSEGREVQLINRKSLRSLTSQLLALLMSQEEQQVTRGLRVEELSQHYLIVYGAPLNPCEYGFLSLSELLKSLPYLVEARMRSKMTGKAKSSMSLCSSHILFFPQLYNIENNNDDKAGNAASGYGEEWVRLTRLYQFARNVRALLHTYHYNQIFLTEFQAAYSKFTGCGLEPRPFGYTSTDELLSAIPQVGSHFLLPVINLCFVSSLSFDGTLHYLPILCHCFVACHYQVVWIKGHGHKRIIVLKNDMKGDGMLCLLKSSLSVCKWHLQTNHMMVFGTMNTWVVFFQVEPTTRMKRKYKDLSLFSFCSKGKPFSPL